MANKILAFAIVFLIMVIPNRAQQPRMMRLDRDDFLKEVLSDKPFPKTLYYDTSVQGSYRMLKGDVVHGLPETAKGQRVDLRGLLIIGPYGSNDVVFIYAFIGEKSSIRVNQLTMAQGRFTYKSTGTMTRVQYQAFCDGLLKANVLISGLPADVRSESSYETVLALWSDGNLDSYYGSSINPKPGANANEFGNLIGKLLHSLTKTYPLNLHSRSTKRPGA